jgi:hypothetical protein
MTHCNPFSICQWLRIAGPIWWASLVIHDLLGNATLAAHCIDGDDRPFVSKHYRECGF